MRDLLRESLYLRCRCSESGHTLGLRHAKVTNELPNHSASWTDSSDEIAVGTSGVEPRERDSGKVARKLHVA